MRIAAFFFWLAALIGLSMFGHFACTEEQWTANTGGSSGAPSPISHLLLLSYSEGVDKSVVAVQLRYINSVEPKHRDAQLTIHCGGERLLAGGDEVPPVVAGLQPAAFYPEACVGEPKVLSEPSTVWLLFPRPKSMGDSFILSLPKITCAGRQCVGLLIPATVEFVRERVRRGFVIHG